MSAADPRVVRSRALIVAAATECFLERGYEHTTMDEIAARAGVVRRTVFNVFAEKEALFRECALGSIATAEAFIRAFVTRIPDIRDPPAELPRIARELARTVFTGPVVPLRRLLAREALRFPDLVAEYWRRAPGAMIAALSLLFARADTRAMLRASDPDAAASQFAYLVLGEELDRRMLGLAPHAIDDVLRCAEQGADLFLRAHRS